MTSPKITLSTAQLWERRYRNQPSTSLPDNEILRLQMAHHSVRSYRSDPIPEGFLEIGIAAASSAATSSNLQTWSVVAVKDQEKRNRLAELAGGQVYIAQAPVFLAWVVDLSRLERVAQREGHSAEALDYAESFLMGTFDTGIAAQNAVVAFESLGLGTVYIGGLRNHPEEVAALLELPERTIAVVGMCVGYPTDNAAGDIKPRLAQDVVLHHEQYEHHQEAERVEAYNQRADAYQQEQGLSSRRWTETVSMRVAKAASLGGRHVMRHVLQRLGFPLD
ncbi:NADPH-dependent oxidoreductase [Saccharibacter sp. 17.LH.SD]|uniref:NADPH-dependent oxidoreductase n=1 Tax=Saccharibacter sp. 17.LH.SD TaxID=2689393 RepID=UPI00136F83A2|nr:NADPH-dependent oxidoreductase [Saccharibacter sp. 17.LH.SD]MXV44975.1 NADPH-dependent oxidoreductase [Saccharibacter sp. 17.LH.SD]